MATKKKTLYEILEVSPTATQDEIRRAHQRLSRKLLSTANNLSREEVDFKLQILDVALHTLSTPLSRDEYDAQITPPMPSANIPTPYTDANALKIAAALAESNRITAALLANQPLPMQAVSTTVNSSVKSLKKIFRFIIGLAIFSMVIKWGGSVLLAQHGSSSGMSSAEEKVMLQEYYQEHGVRPANKAEMDLLETERRRKENTAKTGALEKQKKEDAENKFVEDSRRMGDAASENRLREEEIAREEAARKEEQLAEVRRQREEAEQRRVEAEKQRAEAAQQRLEAEKRRIEETRRRLNGGREE
jgi:curved DNA-binding protein CbpA